MTEFQIAVLGLMVFAWIGLMGFKRRDFAFGSMALFIACGVMLVLSVTVAT